MNKSRVILNYLAVTVMICVLFPPFSICAQLFNQKFHQKLYRNLLFTCRILELPVVDVLRSFFFISLVVFLIIEKNRGKEKTEIFTQ